MKRMWINQPSTLQEWHKLHATNVLYDEKNETIYFLSGNVISMQVIPNILSDGWLEPEPKVNLDFKK